MNKRTQAILDALDERYGVDVACHLHYKEPWQLLIATILSAQCTDARVNIVTKDLFVKYPGIEAFAKADITELEDRYPFYWLLPQQGEEHHCLLPETSH